ncbi:hypothetical protein DM806_24040 [Sphingobium lactosutens]|uniref:hypothetical protein n=1 Tax=Sphingobium lactosutens TaxID=522773 RepID=UPI0015BA6F19|nr:hypothetical protein [Sphingobium lactosutens]NWK98677.1 hypothetical protein [Sphingobium lactosutens]
MIYVRLYPYSQQLAALKANVTSIESSVDQPFTAAEKAKLAGIAGGAQPNAVTSVAGKSGAVALAKGDVGLSDVDNTPDAEKPVSTAMATALAGKATTAQGAKADTAVQPDAPVSTLSETATAKIMTGAERTKLAGISPGAQPNAVTSVAGKSGAVALAKGDVGLPNVDNTSDANKPVSTAVATALAGKASSAQGAKADTAVQPGAAVSELAETATAKIMTAAERAKLAGLDAALAGKATTAQGAKADTAVQPGAAVSELAETATAKIMTAAERAKLAGLDAALAGKATTAQGAKADTAVQPAALQAVDTRLAVVEPLAALVPRYDDRAGDARALFSTAITGDPVARPPLAIGTIVASAAAGAVLRLTGADVDPLLGYVDIAPRIAVPIYEGKTYRVTFRIARAVDPVDPANNAVELRWQNLNHNKNSVSNVRLGAVLTPVVADGVLTYSFVIGKAGAPGALDYVVPPTALYGLPEVRIYGNGQETYLISISPPEDITDNGGVDVPGLSGQVGDLAEALTDLGVSVTEGFENEADARAGDIGTENLGRRQQDVRSAGTPRVAPAHVVGGMMILVEDDQGGLFYVDPLKGKVYLHNLVLDGGEGMVSGGMMPLVRALGGQSMLSFDMFDRRIIAEYGEMLGRPGTVDFDFLRVTEWDEAGQPLAGYEPGQRIRLHPRVLDGLTIQGDHNKVPQLWAVIDSPNGPTRMKRQLTFSQYGVTGYQVIQRPNGSAPGLVRISCNDGDLIRDRHKVRHAIWPVSEPATAAPTKIVYVVVIGQSNSVGAGSYGTNPTGVTGPQTRNTAMMLRGAPFASRLLTWNGGTMPHQGNLDGDVDIGGGVLARTVPIDAARIASLVPMREGLGATGQHVQGGATRESFVTALATHLNGPNGYDGSVYVAGASFGFGSSSFAQLIYDGTDRKQAWLNALASIDSAKTIATANGLALEVHVLIDQGEADWSNASYRSQVEAAWAIMKTDITSRTAQAAAPQLFYHQTIVARGNLQEPAYSALAQVELARNNADIHILPPGYFTDFDTDTIHYKAPEEAWRGALSGEAMADWLIRGETAALLMQSASWAGSKLTATFNHPLTRDGETIVLTAGNGGFSHSNSAGATATISTVLIDQADPSKLVANMSSAIPAGAVETARVAYGNQAVTNPPSQGFAGGQRSVFKRADWRRYSLIDGRPLDIFATIQTLAATQEV